MTKQHIALIGLGVMGGPMATNLLNNGYRLRVHDLDQNKARPLMAVRLLEEANDRLLRSER